MRRVILGALAGAGLVYAAVAGGTEQLISAGPGPSLS